MSTPLPLSERLRIAGEAAKGWPAGHSDEWAYFENKFHTNGVFAEEVLKEDPSLGFG